MTNHLVSKRALNGDDGSTGFVTVANRSVLKRADRCVATVARFVTVANHFVPKPMDRFFVFYQQFYGFRVM